jgi:hypothetical protein
MAKPPVFDRFTHERQKDLLAAEDKRLKSIDDWKGFGMATMGITATALLIVCTGVYFFSFLR